jgi:hypothetical protein
MQILFWRDEIKDRRLYREEITTQLQDADQTTSAYAKNQSQM